MKNLIIVSLSLIILSSCAVGQAVDRGLYSIANAVSSEDLITGERRLSAAERRKQIQEGNRTVASLISKYKKEGKKIDSELSPRQYERAVKIMNRILSVSHLKGESWTLHLIPEDSFNAFVTGGSTVVVHEGLMSQLKIDDEVAAVMAHEIAHVAANHVFEQRASMMASAVAKSSAAKSQAIQVAYTHNNEVEADKVGVLYTALAGYDPLSASRIWQDMYSKRGNNGQMYQSHPITSERIALNKSVAEKVKQYYIPGRVNPNAEAILFNNVLWSKKASSREVGEGGGVAAVAETFLGYYKEKQNAKIEASRQSQRIGMLKDIQTKMKIVDGKMLDNGKVAMLIQYSGSRPVGGLSIKAASPVSYDIYRHNAIVQPNQKFTAHFKDSILKTKDGSKPKIKLVIDEGQYY